MLSKQAQLTTTTKSKASAHINPRLSSQIAQPKTKPASVAMGLSGGVDSSVAAAKLVAQGYQVTGVFLECYKGPGCRANQDRKDALAIALKLNIPFVVLDYKQAYEDRVLEYFFHEYKSGRTPNPDTICNREIKFGLFYDWAIGKGFDYVATGHYARIKTTVHSNLATPSYHLQRAQHPQKDQSYFLYQLKPSQLRHILFPVGAMLKSQVRAEASLLGMNTANKPDSQGICFVGEVRVRDFLKTRIKPKTGKIIYKTKPHPNSSGLGHQEFVIGEHEGISFYTQGQRIGQGLDKTKLKKLFEQRLFPNNPALMPPMFVVAKHADKNQLEVGFEADVYCQQFKVEQFNWLDSGIEKKITSEAQIDVWLRIRNLGQLVPASITLQSPSSLPPRVRAHSHLLVKLTAPIRGVAEGQACVFYSTNSADAVVLGGGVIVSGIPVSDLPSSVRGGSTDAGGFSGSK